MGDIRAHAKLQNPRITPSGRKVTTGKRRRKKEKKKNAVNSGLPKFAPLAHANRSDQFRLRRDLGNLKTFI